MAFSDSILPLLFYLNRSFSNKPISVIVRSIFTQFKINFSILANSLPLFIWRVSNFWNKRVDVTTTRHIGKHSWHVTARPEKKTKSKKKTGISRGLRPGSKVCSENINDLHNLSQGGLEQNEFSPKVNLARFSCALTSNHGHVTCHRVTKNWKWRKLVNWWRIYFIWTNKLAFLKEDNFLR